MTPLRFVVIVLAIAVLNDFFDPQTFEGAVTTSAVGVAVVTLIGYAVNRLYRFYADRVSLEGRFSETDIEDAIHSRRFDRWPTSLRIHEGVQKILIGVMARDGDLNITHINIRPIERGRFWRWRNPAEPLAINFHKIVGRQIEHERRGWPAGGLFNVWHDSKGGFDCLLPLGHSFTLEKGTAIWFEIVVEAKREWTGAIGIRANVLNGPKLLCRRKIEIVGDQNRLNG